MTANATPTVGLPYAKPGKDKHGYHVTCPEHGCGQKFYGVPDDTTGLDPEIAEDVITKTANAMYATHHDAEHGWGGEVMVNVADWDGPALDTFGDGVVIVNAPRPIIGQPVWVGQFRHGTLYAAGDGTDPRLRKSWRSDDAWPVVFTTNAAIETAVLAKFAEYGYASADEAGVTIAEQAACMGLPWHEEAEVSP